MTGPNFHEPDQGPDQARRDEQTPPEELHVIRLTIEDEGYVMMRVECPHEALGVNRPCCTWMEKARDEECICTCDACQQGDHDDCDQEYVPMIGRMWCQVRPIDQCWYAHMASEIGMEAFNFGRATFTITAPVRFIGGTVEDAIDVELVQQ
jgi:hypothetical protein